MYNNIVEAFLIKELLPWKLVNPGDEVDLGISKSLTD